MNPKVTPKFHGTKNFNPGEPHIIEERPSDQLLHQPLRNWHFQYFPTFTGWSKYLKNEEKANFDNKTFVTEQVDIEELSGP